MLKKAWLLTGINVFGFSAEVYQRIKKKQVNLFKVFIERIWEIVLKLTSDFKKIHPLRKEQVYEWLKEEGLEESGIELKQKENIFQFFLP